MVCEFIRSPLYNNTDTLPMGLVIHVMGLFAGFLAGLFGFADDCVSGVLSGNLGCSS